MYSWNLIRVTLDRSNYYITIRTNDDGLLRNEVRIPPELVIWDWFILYSDSNWLFKQNLNTTHNSHHLYACMDPWTRAGCFRLCNFWDKLAVYLDAIVLGTTIIFIVFIKRMVKLTLRTSLFSTIIFFHISPD